LEKHVQPISLTAPQRGNYLNQALLLAGVTIGYNLLEGLVSVLFGFADETLALFGFGLDSFVEVVSGIGIWHMIMRMRGQPGGDQDRFEQTALRITGTAFYLLSAGLLITAAINLIRGHQPDTTWWGVIIALISIVTMGALIHYKKKVGHALNSEAILADANCTRACLYLSFALLAASLGYELTGIGRLDALGALWIAWYAFKEGRESFQKAAGKSCGCDHCV
jgi:divalent metal cation (Fe/Co/Zn/Cd) transporter